MALDFEEMRARQQALQARYAGWWEPVDPEHGRNKILWMLAELGEAIQLVKRNPTEAFMQEGSVRHDFVEELADVLMYFNDVLLCYGITVDELRDVYLKKHERNMKRWKTGDDDAYERK